MNTWIYVCSDQPSNEPMIHYSGCDTCRNAVAKWLEQRPLDPHIICMAVNIEPPLPLTPASQAWLDRNRAKRAAGRPRGAVVLEAVA